MYQSTSSSSSSQKSTGPNHGGAGCGLTRYVSAPGSLLSSAVDSVIGRHRDSTTGLRSPPSLAVPYFSSGDSAVESSCKVAHSTSNDPKSASRDLQGSYGPPEFGLGDFSSTINLNGRSGYGGSSSSPSSSLVRQKSSPAGFFNHLTAAPPDSNGFFVTRGTGNYSSLGGHGVGRLKSQLSFTRQDSLSQISEVSENGIDGVSSHAGIQSMSRSFAPTSFGMDSWDSSNSIVFSPPSSKRAKNVDGDIFNCLNGLESQLSLPQTGLEMGMVEKLLQIPEDYVSCKIRAKRGFATHPRSIAERERRTRISGKLKKLQELVPNMDKQTSYADMLDLAVQHIKGLQNQVLNLHNDLENCTCGCKQSKA